MYCPKCGVKNPEDGKFCRGCGSDIGNVMNAMTQSSDKSESSIWTSGVWADMGMDCSDDGTQKQKKVRTDPDEVFADGIRNSIFGSGFLVATLVLFLAGVAGGRNWWMLMMIIPGFIFISQGIADILKSKRMAPKAARPLHGNPPNTISNSGETNYLPPNYTEPASVESKYRTGELVPPSVTDNTTKLLEKELKEFKN